MLSLHSNIEIAIDSLVIAADKRDGCGGQLLASGCAAVYMSCEGREKACMQIAKSGFQIAWSMSQLSEDTRARLS